MRARLHIGIKVILKNNKKSNNLKAIRAIKARKCNFNKIIIILKHLSIKYQI